MNHLKWMGHSATILDIHKNLRADLKSCEVTVVAKGHCVKAHRFVLSSCSDLLRGLLSDIPIGEECCVMVPDIKGHLLDNVLAFIYLGECSLSSSNLSEFLEAINILGIKSAISFECNTNGLHAAPTSSSNSSGVGTGPVVSSVCGGVVAETEIQPTRHEAVPSVEDTSVSENVSLHEDELMETQNVIHSDEHTTNTNTANTSGESRELDFLNVYHTEPQHKITYSIEPVPGSSAGNEFILTENSGTFTLTHNAKLESSSRADSTSMEVTEDEECDSHIIEEYSSGDERLIQIGEREQTVSVPQTVTAATPPSPATMAQSINNPIASTSTTTSIIQVKPTHIKAIRLKTAATSPQDISNKMQTRSANTSVDSSTETHDPISLLQASNESFTLLKVEPMASSNISHLTSNASATDLAYQAMVNEGMSLPKAAVKFNVSKTDLWRRVRSTGVENLHRSPKLDPEKLDIIELASQAVINEGLSLQKAALRYDISKTVLWRRVRKHPQYMKTARENPIISKAYERLKSGESLKSISQDLDIPMSTLHRHKVRLSMMGQLPDFVTCKRRDSMSKDDLKVKLAKAVHACVHEGMSQNHAANLYEISKSTLWRHLQKRVAEAEEAADTSEGGDQSEPTVAQEYEIKQEVILS